ncbi:MAG: TetR/AcrR family transcriptional regulator [Bacteroidota bacterium]|nr:TetR/AcrR family transcriptional regulator [Bacteroidota bacterium]
MEDKSEKIIGTAQQLFGLYGVEKTTMQEIADDLQISKASLYYYFPDKESLYTAVIRKEQMEFLKILENDLKFIKDPADCLRKYTLARLTYFRKLMNLSRIRLESYSVLRPKLAGSMVDFREEEKKLIIKILEQGKETGRFNIADTEKTSALFLDLLRGLRSAFITDKELLVIDNSEYKILSEKVIGITEIFIKGLMYK